MGSPKKTRPWCVPLAEGEREPVPCVIVGNEELHIELVVCDIQVTLELTGRDKQQWGPRMDRIAQGETRVVSM